MCIQYFWDRSYSSTKTGSHPRSHRWRQQCFTTSLHNHWETPTPEKQPDHQRKLHFDRSSAFKLQEKSTDEPKQCWQTGPTASLGFPHRADGQREDIAWTHPDSLTPAVGSPWARQEEPQLPARSLLQPAPPGISQHTRPEQLQKAKASACVLLGVLLVPLRNTLSSVTMIKMICSSHFLTPNRSWDVLVVSSKKRAPNVTF